MQGNIINFKVDDDLKRHIEDKAEENKMAVGAYIKAVLKKHGKYKEKKHTVK